MAGEPFDEQLVGPSSAAWGRRPGDYGRIAYLTTDGGLAAPPTDDMVRPARLLRAELPVTVSAGHPRRPDQINAQLKHQPEARVIIGMEQRPDSRHRDGP